MENKIGRKRGSNVTPDEAKAMLALYLHTSMPVLDIAKLFKRDRRTLYGVINKYAKPNRKPWFCNYNNHPTNFDKALREAYQNAGKRGDRHDD